MNREEMRAKFVRDMGPLQPSARGYRRGVGHLQDGKPKQFDLGRDKTTAERRLNQIIELWLSNLCELGFDSPAPLKIKPFWQPPYLAAATQVARGEAAAIGSRLADPETYVERLEALREAGVEISVDDPTAERQALNDRRQHLERLQTVTLKRTGQTVAEAVAAYEKHIREEYTSGGELSDNGETIVTRWKSIKKYLGDLSFDLSELTEARLKQIFGIFRNRPQTKYKKPMSRKYAKDIIFEIRRFLEWLHFDKTYIWRKPEDYSRIPWRLKTKLESDRRKDIPTFSYSDLALIWETANPLERCIIAFGLNGAFGADQLGRLTIDEIKLNLNIIDRIRFKNDVAGQWHLFGITRKALEWYLPRRPQPKPEINKQILFVTDLGNSFYEKTAGNKRAKTLPNKWGVLLKRVRKTNPEVPLLPFNSLRDTSINFIRQANGQEVGSLQSCHASATPDKSLDAYSNPVRETHRKALQAFEAELNEKVFNTVADPFPESQKTARSFKTGGGPTPITIRRIRQLRADGLKLAKIGELLDLDRNTVAKYCRPD